MKCGRVQAYVIVTKWLGLFVSGTLVSAWLLSGWCSISWGAKHYSQQGFSYVQFDVSKGGLRVYRLSDPLGISGAFPPTGWRWTRTQGAPSWRLWFAFRDISPRPIAAWESFIPVWAPFLLCALPTALLWHKRRVGSGDCPCGYSRAELGGNAPCPECGREPTGVAGVPASHGGSR